LFLLATPAPTTAPTLAPTYGIKGRIHSRIVGGDIATPEDWPWQIVLINVYTGHRCDGSIVSPYWIVTAAHCFKRSKDINNYIITVGEFLRNISTMGDSSFCLNSDQGKKNEIQHHS
jgi:secreted trypsin-like serine protease